MDNNQFPRQNQPDFNSQQKLEQRLQGSLQEIDLRRERIKKAQPLTIMPLVIILGLLFIILVFFTLFRSCSNIMGPDQTTPTISQLVPRLEALPEYTNQNSLEIKGKTSPNTEIQIIINNQEGSIITSDQYGEFLFPNVSLEEGQNSIKVTLVTNDKNIPESEKESKEYLINLDTTPPNITLSDLKESTDQSPIVVSGQTDANELFIDGTFIHINTDGSFETSLPLSDGDNIVEFKARDKAGNENIKTVTIKYTGKTSPTPDTTKKATRTPAPATKTPASETTSIPKSPTTAPTTKITPVNTSTPKPTTKPTNIPSDSDIKTPKGE